MRHLLLNLYLTAVFITFIWCSRDDNVIEIERSILGDKILTEDIELCSKFKNAKMFRGKCMCRKDDIFHVLDGELGCFSQNGLGGNMSYETFLMVAGFLFDYSMYEKMNDECDSSRKRRGISIPSLAYVTRTTQNITGSYERTTHKPYITTPYQNKFERLEFSIWIDGKFEAITTDEIVNGIYEMTITPGSFEEQGHVCKLKRTCGPKTEILIMKLPGKITYDLSLEFRNEADKEHSVSDFVIKTVVGTVAAIILFAVVVITLVCLKKKGYFTRNSGSHEVNIEKPAVVEPIYVEPDYEYIGKVLNIVKQNDMNQRKPAAFQPIYSSHPPTTNYQEIRLEDIQVATTLYHMLQQGNQQRATQDPAYDTSMKIVEYLKENPQIVNPVDNTNSTNSSDVPRRHSGIASPPPSFRNLQREYQNDAQERAHEVKETDGSLDYNFMAPPSFVDATAPKLGNNNPAKTVDIANTTDIKEENLELEEKIKTVHYKKVAAIPTESNASNYNEGYQNMTEENGKSYQNMPEALHTLSSSPSTSSEVIENPNIAKVKAETKRSSIYKRSISKEPILFNTDEVDMASPTTESGDKNDASHYKVVNI